MPKLTFLGAAGTVTGSKYLVEAEGKRLLVDSGLFQGPKELRLRNWNPLPEKPASFDWCVLTHAHLDHTGYLPRLVRDGFKGPIYADSATIELCNILLADSAHLQEEDTDKAIRGGYSKHAKPLPLYTPADVAPVMKAMREIPRADPFTISPQFTVRPHDAGHILGSSSLELTITENGKKYGCAVFGRRGPLRPAYPEGPRGAAALRRAAVRIHLRRPRPSSRLAGGCAGGRDQSRGQARRRRS